MSLPDERLEDARVICAVRAGRAACSAASAISGTLRRFPRGRSARGPCAARLGRLRRAGLQADRRRREARRRESRRRESLRLKSSAAEKAAAEKAAAEKAATEGCQKLPRRSRRREACRSIACQPAKPSPPEDGCGDSTARVQASRRNARPSVRVVAPDGQPAGIISGRLGVAERKFPFCP